jgi:hypothetical protein
MTTEEVHQEVYAATLTNMQEKEQFREDTHGGVYDATLNSLRSNYLKRRMREILDISGENAINQSSRAAVPTLGDAAKNVHTEAAVDHTSVHSGRALSHIQPNDNFQTEI